MKNSGIVVNVDGDYIEILSLRPSACGSSCENCHAQCESKPETVRALNTVGAKLGDKIEIEVNSTRVLSYISLVYGVPLIAFIAGVAVSFALLGEARQIWSLLIGLITLAISYMVIKKVDNHSETADVKLRKLYE